MEIDDEIFCVCKMKNMRATKDTHLRVLGNPSWALFVYMPPLGHWCCLMEPCLKEQIAMAKHY